MTEKKLHTTNYYNTFIEVADDSIAVAGEITPSKNEKKTVANMQYDMLAKHPYQYTSDDVLFQMYADRNDLTKADYKNKENCFFQRDNLASELHR